MTPSLPASPALWPQHVLLSGLALPPLPAGAPQPPVPSRGLWASGAPFFPGVVPRSPFLTHIPADFRDSADVSGVRTKAQALF